MSSDLSLIGTGVYTKTNPLELSEFSFSPLTKPILSNVLESFSSGMGIKEWSSMTSTQDTFSTYSQNFTKGLDNLSKSVMNKKGCVGGVKKMAEGISKRARSGQFGEKFLSECLSTPVGTKNVLGYLDKFAPFCSKNKKRVSSTVKESMKTCDLMKDNPKTCKYVVNKFKNVLTAKKDSRDLEFQKSATTYLRSGTAGKVSIKEYLTKTHTGPRLEILTRRMIDTPAYQSDGPFCHSAVLFTNEKGEQFVIEYMDTLKGVVQTHTLTEYLKKHENLVDGKMHVHQPREQKTGEKIPKNLSPMDIKIGMTKAMADGTYDVRFHNCHMGVERVLEGFGLGADTTQYTNSTCHKIMKVIFFQPGENE